MAPGFHRTDGRLCVDGLPLEHIASEFGTPLYVYSAAAIERNFRHFDEVVCGGRGQVHFAVKANSNLAVLRLLARAGAGADIVSGGEMRRALEAGFKPGEIIFSGVGKSDAEIIAALEAGIGQINAESASEVDRALALAEGTGASTRLALRVNPGVAGKTHAKISTGTGDTKFGIAARDIPDLYRRIAGSPAMAPGGLAVHIGSQLMDIPPFEAAWGAMLELADSLVAEGLDVPVLDLGGGIGIDYSDGGTLGAEALGAAVKRLFGNSPYRLGFEPGRYLVAEAGVLLTEVLHTKPGPGKTFVVVDGAMNDLLRPTLYEAFHRIETAAPPRGAAGMADIVGPVCETGDYLGLGRELPAVERGDILAVMSAGAYGAVMRSNYNSRPFAPEVMVLDGKAERVSVPQTIDDLLAQDRIPPGLG